jgi:hypothetical protein
MDSTNEIVTPMIVTQCAPARPIFLPNNPAAAAAIKGAKTMLR